MFSVAPVAPRLWWHDIYNVLAMGLSNETDLFETNICEMPQGLNGCTNIADDVLVFSATYDEF